MKHLWQSLLGVGVLTGAARAQDAAPVARVTAIQRVVEKASGTGSFRAAKAGTPLLVGDSVRTGRRSKADLNFSDGSLLRLGQLATVQMQGAKGARLTRGRALFSMLRPGRVLAGAAAAEIKGSVGIITILEGGAAEFSLYSGRMDVVTQTETVPVPPGSYVTIFGNGTRSPVRTAPPLRFASNQKETSLLEAPSDVPFAGSRADEQSRQTPERLTLSDSYYLARLSNVLPFPETGAANSGTHRSRADDALLALALAGGAALAAGPRGAAGADQAHLDEADPSLGHKFNTDVTVAALGAGSDIGFGNGATLAGRVRGLYSRGPVFAQVALAPSYSRFDGFKYSYPGVVSDASISVHTRRGDLEVGRQRLLSGPVRATVIGSIARQGGRQVVDAITFRPDLGRGQRAQISYLSEAFPRYQPFQVGGAQRGFFARAALERHWGNVGLNALRYSNLPVSTAMGVSLDFAFPLVRNGVELYGEIGRDPFRRNSRTVGLAFPGLYQRSGIEAYLEYARLSRRVDSLELPSELTLLLYKRLNAKFALATSVSREGDGAHYATLGITNSTHKYLSDGD